MLCGQPSSDALLKGPEPRMHQRTQIPFLMFRHHDAASIINPLKSLARSYSSLVDPLRPGLFYHLVKNNDSSTAYAVSFLNQAPRKLDSCAVLGWLPASTDDPDALRENVRQFKENPIFRDVLHTTIREGLEDDVDDIQRNNATQLQSGWMHIHDERKLPDANRIGDPDDIISTVLVEDSKIIPKTYTPMPAYRLCTNDGFTSLSSGLMDNLLSVLKQRVSTEGFA